tara:strand:+ start:147 stop:347 length:201 start_codon:yes stop_codon:yes gene_type:complete
LLLELRVLEEVLQLAEVQEVTVLSLIPLPFSQEAVQEAVVVLLLWGMQVLVAPQQQVLVVLVVMVI